ncbi:MAG: phosphohistidine phosphatase SixA [Vicinamibacterales bacterium]
MSAAIEVYLVRHAIAADRGPRYPDDRVRPLTADGVSRFRRAVQGLAALDVTLDVVFTSPLLRARETADLLAAGLKPKPAVEILEALAPGGAPKDVLAAIARAGRTSARLALVGHQPELGDLAARLLGARGRIEFKKGGVALVEVERSTPGGPGMLRWLLPPRALRRLTR